MITKSQYNVYFEFNQQKYAFNTWKGNLVLLNDKTYSALKTNSIQNLTEEEISNMLNLGYLTKIKDEFEEVLSENQKTLINNKFSICITPTFRCNAACEYCFEKGISSEEINDNTIANIVQYIADHYDGRKVHITWFGGEPLLSVDKINYICNMLRDLKIEFSSSMISNGYLLNENLQSMKRDWNLRRIQITLDGLYERYNNTKKIAPDAFDKVIENIGLAIKEKIRVSIRINYDAQNFDDYKETISFIYENFGNSVDVYFHDIVGETYLTPNEVKPNPSIAIYEALIDYGYIKNIKDMKIKRTYRACALNVDDYVIVCPDGSLTKCEHYVGKESQFDNGNINDNTIYTAKKFPVARTECKRCVCFPICGGGCYSNHLIRKNAGCLRIKSALKDVLKLYIRRLYDGNNIE